MKPVLFVLAAGMGSRYGGLKQLDGVGPNGETIMDYSIFDAIRNGFGKVVFVIRHDFEKDFREKIISKYINHIPVEVVFQDVTALPEGFTPNPERVKPWGTNHAILMGKKVINEPFAVINADDFYGNDSFRVMSDALSKLAGKKDTYCMVGFHVGNTLSESGEVSRGVCATDDNNCLSTVTERHHIKRREGKVSYMLEDDDNVYELEDNAVVSMNLWGFTPDYFDYSEKAFVDFLKKNTNELKSEFYIPSMVNELINNKTAVVKVYETQSSWFGVTYSEDRPTVVNKIKELVSLGEYPEKLF